MRQIAVLAAEAATAEEELNPLVPHIAEIIVGLVAFGLLLLVLGRAVVPRFEKAFDQRSAAIEGGMRRAEQAQAEAQAALEEYRSQLADARHESARMREEAREQGAAILVEMREEAQARANGIITSAQEQIAADRQRAATQLRTEVGGIAAQLAERIVGESLADDGRQQRVIDRFLDELETTGGEPVSGDGSRAASGGRHQSRPTDSTDSTPITDEPVAGGGDSAAGAPRGATALGAPPKAGGGG